MNLSVTRSKADFIGLLNPKVWDAVYPHMPFVFSNAFVELLVVDVVNEVATAVADRTLRKKSLGLSQPLGAPEPVRRVCGGCVRVSALGPHHDRLRDDVTARRAAFAVLVRE